MECIHCGHQNPDNEVLCVHCGLPIRSKLSDFKPPEIPESVTRKLNLSSDLAMFPRWGTSSLGTEHKLVLHIRGQDVPLVVTLQDWVLVGRLDTDTGELPDVSLDAYGAEELGVSRRHAAIVKEEDALKVVDLGSANFTYINGQKLVANQPRILRDGDELRLGRMVIRVQFA